MGGLAQSEFRLVCCRGSGKRVAGISEALTRYASLRGHLTPTCQGKGDLSVRWVSMTSIQTIHLISCRDNSSQIRVFAL